MTRRGPRPPRELCSGPARLCQALAIDGDDDGADLVVGDRGIQIVDDGVAPPSLAGCSRRIGLSKGVEHPWRWFVPDDPNVSRRAGPRRGSSADRLSCALAAHFPLLDRLI